jgi:hypothetical protein
MRVCKRQVGVDLDEGCKDVYALLVGEENGFAVTGDSAEMAEFYPLWVSDRADLGGVCRSEIERECV